MKYMLIVLSLLLTGCFKSEYFEQIYDKDAIDKPLSCLKLKLTPYNDGVYDTAKTLYKFDNNCDNVLQIRYKTNIACNSRFNTHKQFHSFVELNILKHNKLIYTIYKDLKNSDDIKQEIKKGYKQLCKTIQI